MDKLQPGLTADLAKLQQGLTTTLLLSILCFVLVMTTLLVLLVARWRRRQEKLFAVEEFDAFKLKSEASFPGFRSMGCRRPQTWLAIKSRNLEMVQRALSLQDAKPCLWMDGLAGEKRLFVAPPVTGWILVFGPALPEPDEDVDACFRFLLNLSHKLGHVQYFSVNSALNYHAWAQMDSGQVVRGYAWAGKTLWNQGEKTPQEMALSMRCVDYAMVAETSSFGGGDFGNAEKVHLLAAQWSVDPEEIDERLMEHEWGVAGEPSGFF
jgi:hypothetical protein